MDLRYKELYWLLGRKSHLTVDNQLLLYKSIITPIWTYGIELRGFACKYNIAVIQRCQSKILRAIVDAPRYVTNDMIHKDIGIPTVQKVIHERSIKHRTNLESHSNPLLQPLPRDNFIRRLKRRWPADLLYGQRDLLPGGELITLVSLQVRLPASTLTYRILCTLIADLINTQKKCVWLVI